MIGFLGAMFWLEDPFVGVLRVAIGIPPVFTMDESLPDMILDGEDKDKLSVDAVIDFVGVDGSGILNPKLDAIFQL